MKHWDMPLVERLSSHTLHIPGAIKEGPGSQMGLNETVQPRQLWVTRHEGFEDLTKNLSFLQKKTASQLHKKPILITRFTLDWVREKNTC